MTTMNPQAKYFMIAVTGSGIPSRLAIHPIKSPTTLPVLLLAGNIGFELPSVGMTPDVVEPVINFNTGDPGPRNVPPHAPFDHAVHHGLQSVPPFEMATAARAFAIGSSVDCDPWIELICHKPRSVDPFLLAVLMADGLPPDSAKAIAAAIGA
jgi:hypothetical protein